MYDTNQKRRSQKMKKMISVVCFLVVITTGPAVAKEVPINPITGDIRNKLKSTTSLVSDVEDTMAPKVTRLAKIYKTYMDTCKGKEEDRGCAEIQNQIRERYKEVLSTMADRLPKVRDSVFSTARELGHSIKAKTRRKDLRELFERISKKGSFPKIRGPLSRKLSQLLKAMGSPDMNVSILELSLQTQADLIAATEYIEFLEAKISHQMVMVDMIQDFGVLSPEMASVMKGVSELFGYDVEFEAPDVEDGSISDDWRY